MLDQFSELLVHFLAALLELDRLFVIETPLVSLFHGQQRVLVTLNDKLEWLDNMFPDL